MGIVSKSGKGGEGDASPAPPPSSYTYESLLLEDLPIGECLLLAICMSLVFSRVQKQFHVWGYCV